MEYKELTKAQIFDIRNNIRDCIRHIKSEKDSPYNDFLYANFPCFKTLETDSQQIKEYIINTEDKDLAHEFAKLERRPFYEVSRWNNAELTRVCTIAVSNLFDIHNWFLENVCNIPIEEVRNCKWFVHTETGEVCNSDTGQTLKACMNIVYNEEQVKDKVKTLFTDKEYYTAEEYTALLDSIYIEAGTGKQQAEIISEKRTLIDLFYDIAVKTEQLNSPVTRLDCLDSVSIINEEKEQVRTLLFTKIGITASTQPETAPESPETARAVKHRGRPSKPFEQCLLGSEEEKKATKERLHTLLDDKEGNVICLMLKAAIKTGKIVKPTYTAVTKEFGEKLSESLYNNCMNNVQAFTTNEIDGAIKAL